MIRLELKGMTEAAGYLDALAKNQLPYATSRAVNDLAFEIRDAQINAIKRIFDRPKPQTAKNIFVVKGTKSNPVAKIRFDQLYDVGIDEYMLANVEGGARKMKPSERTLKRFWVPGAGAKLDKYGNMRGSQITQILSRLGRFAEVGYKMNETAGSKGKRRGAKKSTEYFMVTSTRGGLKPGIYQRTQSGVGFGGKTAKALPAGSFQKGSRSRMVQDPKTGKFIRAESVSGIQSVVRGRGALPVMVFTRKAPAYHPVWPFFAIGQGVVTARAKIIFERWIAEAVRTAK